MLVPLGVLLSVLLTAFAAVCAGVVVWTTSCLLLITWTGKRLNCPACWLERKFSK
jgi:hypothetical protein